MFQIISLGFMFLVTQTTVLSGALLEAFYHLVEENQSHRIVLRQDNLLQQHSRTDITACHGCQHNSRTGAWKGAQYMHHEYFMSLNMILHLTPLLFLHFGEV